MLMKKLFTLIAAALLAASVNAQTETPLVLGGGWNNGFVGDADVFDYTITKQWGAAEFACNVNSADYPKFVLEFDEPLPANCQVNYFWKASADAEGDATPQYGAAVGDGTTTKYELAFNPEHAYITNIAVQHTDDVEAVLKVKKLTLVGADGKDKTVAPTFTGWAGTDNTIAYKGTVSYNSQWQQLGIKGVEGKSDITVKVRLAEPTPNVQMCVNYEEGSEWPGFNGEKEVTFTTKEGAKLKDMGIQYTDEAGTPISVYVEGAWLVTGASTGISNIENLEVAKAGKIFNLAGQQVGKGYKGLVIKNGKKVVVK